MLMRSTEGLQELQAALSKFGWAEDESSSSANSQLFLPRKS